MSRVKGGGGSSRGSTPTSSPSRTPNHANAKGSLPPPPGHSGKVLNPEESFTQFAGEALMSTDQTFVEMFLLTYRSFEDGTTLLSIWTQRITEANQSKSKKKAAKIEQLLNFMKSWIRNYFIDFGSTHRNTVLKTIGEVCGIQATNEFKLIMFQGNSQVKVSASRASPAQVRRHSNKLSLNNSAGNLPPAGPALQRMLSDPVRLKTNKRATDALLVSISSVISFNFLEAPSGLLAYELSRIEAGIFRSIAPREFLDKGWQGSHSPNLSDMIRRFNEVSYWVATEILQHGDEKTQVEVIKQFVKIADKIYTKYHNFNGMMEILSGLELTPVQRLKKAWAQVPIRSLGRIGKLRSIMQTEGNFRRYRSELAAINEEKTPKIPYMPIVLKDFTFIEEGNAKYDEDGRVNVDRLQLLSAQLANIKRMQQHCFYKKKQGVTEGMRRYLANLNVVQDDEELHRLSLKRQPKLPQRKRSASDGDLSLELNDSTAQQQQQQQGNNTISKASTTSSSNSSSSKSDQNMTQKISEAKAAWEAKAKAGQQEFMNQQSAKWASFDDKMKKRSAEQTNSLHSSINLSGIPLGALSSSGGLPRSSRSQVLVSQEMARILDKKQPTQVQPVNPLTPPSPSSEGATTKTTTTPTNSPSKKPRDHRMKKSTSEYIKPRAKSDDDMSKLEASKDLIKRINEAEESSSSSKKKQKGFDDPIGDGPIVKARSDGVINKKKGVDEKEEEKREEGEAKAKQGRKSSLEGFDVSTMTIPPPRKLVKKKKTRVKKVRRLKSAPLNSSTEGEEEGKEKEKEKEEESEEKNEKKKQKQKKKEGKHTVTFLVVGQDGRNRKCVVSVDTSFDEFLEKVGNCQSKDADCAVESGGEARGAGLQTFMYENENEEKVKVTSEEDFSDFFEFSLQRDKEYNLVWPF